jgi:MerR family transcriptional regulator, mercuric resistance operon regulatory protein
MPNTAPVSLDDLSALAGIEAETILDYEKRGLLPAPRMRSGRRTSTPYHQEHIDRLHFIRRCRDLGFTLEAVADLLAVDGGMRTCGDVYMIASRQLDSVRQRIAELQRIEAVLSPLVDACPRTGLVHHCPIWTALQDKSTVN